MKRALLIIDIQNDYFEGGTNPLTGSYEASEKARMLLEEFRINNLPVIHVQHLAARPTASFFLPGTVGAEIHPNVKPLENEKVIIKHYPNSFHDTQLLGYLKDMDIKELVICGMMTHMCVDSTVRAAKDYGFTCIVIGDACATKDLEINGEKVKSAEVQKAFLSALAYFYSTVLTTGQFLPTLNKKS